LAFNPLNWLLGLFSLDIGIDLGTANTMVNVRGKGIVISEPSVVAIDKRTREPLRIGAEAKEMIGRTPANVIAVRPLRDGVISEFEITQAMLEYFIGKVHQQTIVPVPRPRVVVGIPAGVTKVEKRAVYDAALSAGAREVYLIEEPLAAAIGAGLPISEPGGNLVLDIGGGTTEVAVISLSGIVDTHCVQAAGDTFNEAILQYVKRKYNLFIGENTAELAKIRLASAWHMDESKVMEVKGRDLIMGLPRRVLLRSGEVREAIQETLNEIVDAVKVMLERTPPELTVDIMERGITLTGGGALLSQLDILLHNETGLPIHIAKDPVACVALGSGKALQELSLLKKVAVEG